MLHYIYCYAECRGVLIRRANKPSATKLERFITLTAGSSDQWRKRCRLQRVQGSRHHQEGRGQQHRLGRQRQVRT